MVFPIILMIAAGAALFGCNSTRDDKNQHFNPDDIPIGPEPIASNPTKSPYAMPLNVDEAVNANFKRLCEGFFQNKQSKPQSYCEKLWSNSSLSSYDQLIRNKIFSYAKRPLPSDLDNHLNYSELKVRPILEKDMETLLSRAQVESR
jgi:hypothetical protein